MDRVLGASVVAGVLGALVLINPAGSEPVATPWPENAHVIGTVDRYEPFPTERIAPRTVDVWLPPQYDADPAARFAVLYMHDGQNLFDPANSALSGEEWGMDEAITRLADEGVIQPPIVVGVWSGATRYEELMPQRAVPADYTGKIDRAALRGDAYLTFLADELKPFVDRTYRTKPDRAHTFVMGSSMGGLASIYALIERPDVFGGAGCVSTHWPTGDGIVVDYVKENLPPPGDHRIYYDFGTATVDATYEPFQRKVDAIMATAGYTRYVDWMTRKYDGHPHSETAWRRRVHIPLTFLLK